MNFAYKILALLVLIVMFGLAVASSWNDAATFDESSHIAAGYSYITQKDMRINPEHPPLLKDMAGLALMLVRPTYRTDTPQWQNGVNEQWAQGAAFLYDWGNDPDRILHFARFPTILLALLTGFLFFLWAAKHFGNKTALLATFFYAFSPTVLAHSRLVTTDIAATFAFLLGIMSFLWFLEKQTLKRVVLAGLAFGTAELLKFSLVLLVPIYFVLAISWLFARRENLRAYIMTLFKILGIFFIGALVIWIVYIYHIWNYPQEKQLADAQVLVGGFKPHAIATLDFWLTGQKLTRPLGHYLLGVMMVTQRSAGGNAAYFMGEVSSKGWRSYFPVMYTTKETLALHALTIIALLLVVISLLRSKEKTNARDWIKNHFVIFTSIFFIAFYWAYSMANPLNIGIRHMLPTFPFIYLLVARALTSEKISYTNNKPFKIILGAMLVWMTVSTLLAFPSFLSYYNEIAGGTKLGWRVATDSNYDWGQDLKRLGNFASRHPNEKIYLDYFGGGSPKYYLGDQYEPWWSAKGAPPQGSLFAVSANARVGAQAKSVNGFPEPKPEDTYSWLKNLEPLDHKEFPSLFIYRIP